ncbi:MAG: DTW domain-containing protein [Alphaproteobacteria bacterium]|nr:DTW domain-containing protein [Alphaproteobacteria bacterium]
MTDDVNTFCPKCGKIKGLCVCTEAEPFDNRRFVLIMQHPQEQDKELGTAGILKSMLKNSQLEIALSRPGLAAVLKRQADPKKWGVLYLGAQKETPVAPGLYVLNKKGELAADADQCLQELEGIILLDGSWSQAKALWWRNPWLLKTRRLLLVPEKRSLYGKLRKEPRRESVSTLEACAQCLNYLGEAPEIAAALTDAFARLLKNYKALRTKQSD